MATNLEDYYKPGHHPFYVRRSFLLENEPLPHRSANNRKYYTAIGRKRRKSKEHLFPGNASITRTFPRRGYPDVRDIFRNRLSRPGGSVNRLGEQANTHNKYSEYWRRSTSANLNHEERKYNVSQSPPRTPLPSSQRAQFTRQLSHMSRSSSERISPNPVSISTFYPLASNSIPRPQRASLDAIGRQWTDPLPQGSHDIDSDNKLSDNKLDNDLVNNTMQENAVTNDPLHRSSHFPSFLSETLNPEKIKKLDKMQPPFYYKLPVHHKPHSVSSLRGPHRSFGAMGGKSEQVTTYEGKFSVLQEIVRSSEKTGYVNNGGHFSDDVFGGNPKAAFYAGQNRRRPHVKDIFTEKWVRHHHTKFGYFGNSDDDNDSSSGSEPGVIASPPPDNVEIKISEKTHMTVQSNDYFGNTSSSSGSGEFTYHKSTSFNMTKHSHFNPLDLRADDDTDKRFGQYEDAWDSGRKISVTDSAGPSYPINIDVDVEHVNIPIHPEQEPSFGFYRPTDPVPNTGDVVLFVRGEDGEDYVEYQPGDKPTTNGVTFSQTSSFRRKCCCALITLSFIITLAVVGSILGFTLLKPLKETDPANVAPSVLNITAATTTMAPTTIRTIPPNTTIVIVVDGSVRVINIPYSAEHSNQESDKFKESAKQFCEEMKDGYSQSDLNEVYRTCVVKHFRNGSLITDFQIQFDKPQQLEMETTIKKTFKEVMLKSTIYQIDVDSIKMTFKDAYVKITQPRPTSPVTTLKPTTTEKITTTETKTTVAMTTTEKPTTIQTTEETTTTQEVLTTTVTTTTGEFTCGGNKHNGFYPDPRDCTRYYSCIGGLPNQRQCAKGQMWKQDAFACVTYNATACGHTTNTTLSNAALPSETTTQMTTTYPTTTTIREPRTTEQECHTGVSFIPSTVDCRDFFGCSNGQKIAFTCPSNTHWSQQSKNCISNRGIYPDGCFNVATPNPQPFL